MAGTRYGHKLKARLNKGNSHLCKEKGNVKTDFHIYPQEGQIGMDELAEMFFCTIEKIKKARRLRIITEVDSSHGYGKGKKYFFDRNEAIKSLSKFKDKNGFLSI